MFATLIKEGNAIVVVSAGSLMPLMVEEEPTVASPLTELPAAMATVAMVVADSVVLLAPKVSATHSREMNAKEATPAATATPLVVLADILPVLVDILPVPVATPVLLAPLASAMLSKEATVTVATLVDTSTTTLLLLALLAPLASAMLSRETNANEATPADIHTSLPLSLWKTKY